MTTPTPATTAAASALLAWYDDHRRDLPWRESRDPYRIWISEIMLQQTRVSVVLPYWKAFLERFPTVDALASAAQSDVLAAWSGLGYYRRARQLHQAAGEIVGRGGFPRSAAQLMEISGFGPYTAAAVASIAFGEAVPALDGNLERVLCRLHGIAENPKRSAVRRRLTELASEMLDSRRPGDGNQALMDLGSQICTPRGPDCPKCPLATDCVARREGRPEAYPPPRERRKSEQVRWLTLLVSTNEEADEDTNERIVLFRRPESSAILPGLWELPTLDQGERFTLRSAEHRFGEDYGGVWKIGKRLGTVRHSITYRALTIEVRRAEWTGETRREMRRVRREEVGTMESSSLLLKVLNAIAA